MLGIQVEEEKEEGEEKKKGRLGKNVYGEC